MGQVKYSKLGSAPGLCKDCALRAHAGAIHGCGRNMLGLYRCPGFDLIYTTSIPGFRGVLTRLVNSTRDWRDLREQRWLLRKELKRWVR